MERHYGDTNVVFVDFSKTFGQGFDGQSHRDLMAWVRSKFGLEMTEQDVIGWSVRCEGAAIVIRYGSGRNHFGEKMGDNKKFTPRPENMTYTNKATGEVRAIDPRELPKAWAEWVRNTLTTQLGMSVVESNEHRVNARDFMVRASLVVDQNRIT